MRGREQGGKGAAEGGVLAVYQAREQERGKQEVEAGGGARARARRHASAYWQRLKTVGSWAGPQPQCWARWGARWAAGRWPGSSSLFLFLLF